MNWRDLFQRSDEPEERISTPAPTVAMGTGRLEPGSDTWLYVTAHAESEIKRLREKNDSTALDSTQTASIRGQIKALKALLALGQPKSDNRRHSVEED